MFKNKIFFDFFFDCVGLVIQSQFFLTLKLLVLSKQSNFMAWKSKFLTRHILVVFLVKDHKNSFRFNTILTFLKNGQFRTFLICHTKVTVCKDFFLCDSQSFIASILAQEFFDVFFLNVLSCNPEIMWIHDLFEVFWGFKDTCCSRHSHQDHGWKNSNRR